MTTNEEVFQLLLEWRARFRDPEPEDFVPTERYGLDGKSGYKTGAVAVWSIIPKNRSEAGTWPGPLAAK
jgi:hypothetical protein